MAGSTELWKMDAVALSQAIRTRQVSAVEVTEAALHHVETLDPRHCHGNSGTLSAVTIDCLDAADLVCPSPVPACRHPACRVALSPLHTELPGR